MVTLKWSTIQHFSVCSFSDDWILRINQVRIHQSYPVCNNNFILLLVPRLYIFQAIIWVWAWPVALLMYEYDHRNRWPISFVLGIICCITYTYYTTIMYIRTWHHNTYLIITSNKYNRTLKIAQVRPALSRS